MTARILPIGELPVCVFCKRGTTPRRLVRVWHAPGRYYHAHMGCALRNGDKPIPPEPPVNCGRRTPSPDERLKEWNALADQLDHLLAQCRAEPRALTTLRISRRICAALSWRRGSMSWALGNPRLERFDEAGELVKGLRWHVERLRAALARDPSRREQRCACNIESPDLHLPETAPASTWPKAIEHQDAASAANDDDQLNAAFDAVMRD